ncbi:hypothetical protein ACFL1H_06160 [Nanoarchaeota archaeon]
MGTLETILEFVGKHPFITFFMGLVVVGGVVEGVQAVTGNYPTYTIERKDVKWGTEKETYVEIDGDKYYLEIDEKRIEDTYK